MQEVFGYIRTSTNDGRQDLSLEVQEDKIKKYCELTNKKLLQIYTDKISGGTKATERPEMKKLLTRLQNGEGDGVVCAKTDRISRNFTDFVALLEYFINNKIDFFSIDPQLDTSTPIGKMMIQILSSFGEMEKTQTKSRINDTIKLKKQKGDLLGTAPFGMKSKETDEILKNGKKKKILEVDENEKVIIEKIIELKKNKMSNKKICEELTILKMSNRKNIKWNPEQIRRILKNNSMIKEKTKKKVNKKRGKIINDNI
jgi:site-specific DNA recombinase